MPPRNNVSYAPPPTVLPTQAVELSSARSRLLMEYAQQQAQNRLAITEAKVGYKRKEEEIRQARLGGLQQVMTGAVDRGILGSSHEITERLGVHGAAEAAKAAAMNEQESVRTAIRLNQQFGVLGLQMGLHDIDARRRALQSMAAIQEFEQNTIPGAPGVGTAGGGRAQIIVPGVSRDAKGNIIGGNPFDIAAARRNNRRRPAGVY